MKNLSTSSTTRTITIVSIVAILTLTGALYFQRTQLSEWAFSITGEEELPGQVRGVAQVAFNVTRPSPQTAPYTPVVHAGVNPFGINTFLHQEVEIEKREEIARLVSEAGFYWIRQEFPWEDIEISARGDFIDRRNDPNGVDAWEKYDNIVDIAEAYDLEIIARLDNPPSWSRSQPDDVIGTTAPPDDYADFANYAATVAERYEGRIRYFQVWNEPNIFPEWGNQNVSPEQYTELLCLTYAAIKEVNPDAVVLTGALAPTSELTGRDFNDFIFLERMYTAGAGDCFDILSVQGYGLWSGPTDRRMRPIVVNYGRNQFIRDIMLRNGDGDKAIWISEMAWNAAPEGVEPRFGRVTLDQQARWAPLAYERAQQEWPWVGAINYWYFKRADDVWLSEQRPEAYFQVAEPDFTLMPVYEELKAYTAQTPVMHAGAHYAPHWAIDYEQGWELSDTDAVVIDPSQNSAQFLFEGRRIEINLQTADGESCATNIFIDDEAVSDNPQPCGTWEWSGRAGQYEVRLEPETVVRLETITIYDRQLPWSVVALVSIGLLAIGGFTLHKTRSST